MFRKYHLLFVVLLVACPRWWPDTCGGAEQIYDPSPDHLWNKLHRNFYSHKFSNGEVYEHDAALDPPWSNWAPFYNDQEFNARIIAALEAFVAQPEDQLQNQPSLRRAVMLRDLWPVFDSQTRKALAKDEAAARRQAKLRELLAKAMLPLELSDEEVQQLPSNYQAACEKKLFPLSFDANSPNRAFLPLDLFDKEGRWIPHTSHVDRVGALHHATTSNCRTIFLPLMRVADDRKATLDFLSRFTKSRGMLAVPNGTVLALVRITVLPTRSGGLMVTPLIESLQLIVVDEPKDHHFKFVLDRAALLNGGDGLRVVTEQEPVDA